MPSPRPNSNFGAKHARDTRETGEEDGHAGGGSHRAHGLTGELLCNRRQITNLRRIHMGQTDTQTDTHTHTEIMFVGIYSLQTVTIIVVYLYYTFNLYLSQSL